jgi:hypothetical protein
VQKNFVEDYTRNQDLRLLLMYNKLRMDVDLNVTSIINYDLAFSDLEFRNPVTGVPLSYDVYIKRHDVTYERQYLLFFSSVSQVFNYYTVDKVEINYQKSNDIERRYGRLSFRINPITNIIKIRAELFTDTLGIFGGYWSMFVLLGRMIAQTYGGYFYTADLYNTVYRYHDDDPDYDPDKPDDEKPKSTLDDSVDSKKCRKPNKYPTRAFLKYNPPPSSTTDIKVNSNKTNNNFANNGKFNIKDGKLDGDIYQIVEGIIKM